MTVQGFTANPSRTSSTSGSEVSFRLTRRNEVRQTATG